MSDPNDRDRGGRRSRRRRGGPGSGVIRKEREYEEGAQAPTKPPIILAKPTNEQPGNQGNAGSAPRQSSPNSSLTRTTRHQEKPVVMLKSREERKSSISSHSKSGFNPPTVPSSDPTPSVNQPYSIQRTLPAHQGSNDVPGLNRLSGPQETSHAVKLVDESLQWCDGGMELLYDQTDFLVVGFLGLQGSGKSTIASLLAGNSPSDSQRKFVFAPQSREMRETCEHQTVGVDMCVTSQRVIVLDAQPLMSPSVLDYLIRHDKKYPAEYSTAENCIEMQSLQLVAFLMTVCHVMVVVQDWFTDIHLLRCLQTAEMLKPSTPASSHDSSTGQDDSADYYPHVVFVLNKANREDFNLQNFTTMQKTLENVFDNSRLRLAGSATLANGKSLPGLNDKTVDSDINLFLLPWMDSAKPETQDTILTFLPEYRGYPSFQTLISSLRDQICSISRDPLTHTSLSEKNWFHYAARTWDAVKKSQLMSEYNRLLP
ncbi:hypothetical protein ScPMuIL_006658 [Solemya velum]